MPRFGYSPSEADQVKVKVEGDLRAIRHRLSVLANRVKGPGAIQTEIDELDRKVEGIADDLCRLVDDRTEVPAGAAW